MPTTNELLTERGKTHGDYSLHAAITQSLKACMQRSHTVGNNAIGTNWHSLTSTQREALEMIAHKIGRILAGDPNHRDHWDDIAGYAKLVADRCTK